MSAAEDIARLARAEALDLLRLAPMVITSSQMEWFVGRFDPADIADAESVRVSDPSRYASVIEECSIEPDPALALAKIVAIARR